jgi:probable O-glycosylation ligase (exosortase A-associated)
VFTLVTGGNYRLWGPPGSFIGDNNDLGLALLLTLPLVRYLQLEATRRWLRYGLLVLALCCIVAALGTHSRGALVGLVVTLVALLVKSRHRIRIALAAGLALAAAVQLMPAHWEARMESILAYQEDASVQARFDSWRYALDVARERPVLGGGFEIFRGNEASTGAGYRAAHSIYFEVLAEHGWVGLMIFLALLVGAYRAAGAVIRQAQEQPDLRWASDLARMAQVSLVAYATAGLFLNLATFDLFYHVLVIVVIVRVLTREPLPAAEGRPAHAMPVG